MSSDEFLAQQKIEAGKKIVGESRITIRGICRNNATTIPATLKRMYELGKLASQYDMFLYENNSTDNTTGVIQEQAGLYKLSFSLDTIDNFVPFKQVATKRRAAHMAYCRNRYLEKLQEQADKYDYLVVVDMDLANWNTDAVLHSFSYMDRYDVISANGVDRFRDTNIYYDIWTLIIDGKLLNRQIRQPWVRYHPLVSVDSAFGGLAIYKVPAILDVSYGLWHDENGLFGSEHTGLHMALKAKGCKQAINPFMVVDR